MSEQPEPRSLFDRHMREHLLIHRILVLDGQLDDDNGMMLASQLMSLAEDNAADIGLWIHSPGGSVPSMLALRD
ncbi:ATP-dependent Clp protease proteolytic subunit, partial [Arthrobacter rhombi]